MPEAAELLDTGHRGHGRPVAGLRARAGDELGGTDAEIADLATLPTA
ncbi:hypothetical protein ABZY42_28295 [Streptomyces sp. NPDC006622]